MDRGMGNGSDRGNIIVPVELIVQPVIYVFCGLQLDYKTRAIDSCSCRVATIVPTGTIVRIFLE